MLFEQITVIGVGLIGGSVGLAARARRLARRVVGVGRDPRTLSRAVELGAIDSFFTRIPEGVAGSGLVVVCTPVDRIVEVIRTAVDHCRGALFTDAGSVKGGLYRAVHECLPDGSEYVPAHPLAGAEKAGVEHARADLFENRVTIVTTDAVDADASERVEAFWAALGSRIVRMDADEHDRVLASTSHLPHAVASGVAISTPVGYLPLSAGGFRDVTRIAAGDPQLWTAIFQANREPVLAALRGFTEQLNEFRRCLETGDGAGLVKWLSDAKQVRDALGS
jgi:prephenate dehydrogenase